MKLIITASIKKTEFKPLQKKFSLDVIKITAKKCLEGLGKSIKNSVKIPKTRLKKLFLTGPGGAGRVMFLLEISAKKSILVMLRPKNDKKIGINMNYKF